MHAAAWPWVPCWCQNAQMPASANQCKQNVHEKLIHVSSQLMPHPCQGATHAPWAGALYELCQSKLSCCHLDSARPLQGISWHCCSPYGYARGCLEVTALLKAAAVSDGLAMSVLAVAPQSTLSACKALQVVLLGAVMVYICRSMEGHVLQPLHLTKALQTLSL